MSPQLEEFNAQLALAGSNLRVAKAELLIEGSGWDGVTSTTIFANDRARGVGAEWVNRDPRRDGRVGVTYAFGSSHPSFAVTLNAAGTGLRLLTLDELSAHVDEGMNAWGNIACSDAPITRVGIADGTDPDLSDDFFLAFPPGAPPSANYAQPADIVQASWITNTFFRNVAAFFGLPPSVGNNIIGVTLSFVFADANGLTDIDGNGQLDLGLAELYYNNRFIWVADGRPGFIDLFSIITHESGHSLGLAHFGKIFVTKHDLSDGVLTLSDINFAPESMMNAIYFSGRSEIRGTDNSSFCQLWANAN